MPSITTKRGPRTRLLDTAGNLFYAQGYRSTGINQILAEADVAKASFYHHFSSKEDLLVAYLQEFHEHAMGALRAQVERARSAAGRVRAVFDFFERRTRARDFCGCPFLNICGELPQPPAAVHNVIVKHQDETRDLLRTLVKEHFDSQRAPRPAAAQISAVADELYLLLEGSIAATRLHQQHWPLRTAARLAEQRLGLKS